MLERTEEKEGKIWTKCEDCEIFAKQNLNKIVRSNCNRAWRLPWITIKLDNNCRWLLWTNRVNLGCVKLTSTNYQTKRYSTNRNV